MVWRRPQFNKADSEIINRETLFQGFFRMEKYTLRHKLFSGDWGQPIVRELFYRSSAVGVLLYDPEHRLIGLVEQYRIGALGEESGPWLLEVVAGMVNKDEMPEQVARRELEEESGITQVVIEPICNYLVSPGGTNEKLYLYAGLTDLSANKGGVFGLPEEDEDIRLHIIAADEAYDMLTSDRFNNAATVVSLMWLQLNETKLRASYLEMGAG